MGLAGRSVNVKSNLKREGLLDMTEAPELDYYLVLMAPKAAATDVRTLRPRRIDSACLLDSVQLLAEQRARGVKIGVASGVRRAQWAAAEIYPTAANTALILTDEQRQLLRLFGG